MSFAGSALFFLGKRHSTLQGLQSMMYDDDAMRWKVSKLQIWQPRTFSKSMASLSSKMSWVLLSVLSLDLLKDILTIDVMDFFSSHPNIWKSPRRSHCGRDLDFTGRAHRRTSASSDGNLVLVVFGTLWTARRTGPKWRARPTVWSMCIFSFH